MVNGRQSVPASMHVVQNELPVRFGSQDTT